MDLVLASTSRYRRAQLERLGVPFRWLDPGVDEEALKGQGLDPRELAERLAAAKAVRFCEDWPGATIIGGDQVAAFEGQTLGKPGTPERAVDQLLAMAGRAHELITAVAVWHGGQLHAHTDVATLVMRSLTRDEVTRYVQADQPFDCAGGYKLEERGITLFERIACADHSAITGLPLIALTTILRQLGYPIP